MGEHAASESSAAVEADGVLPPAEAAVAEDPAPAEVAAAPEDVPAASIPAAAYEQVIAELEAAGDDPDRQRAALKRAAGLAVAAGISVTLPVQDLTEPAPVQEPALEATEQAPASGV